jgi:hypothetical protein
MSWTEGYHENAAVADLADAEPRDEPEHGRCRNDFLCCYHPEMPCFLTRSLWPMRPERAAVTYGATGRLAPTVESPWDPRR